MLHLALIYMLLQIYRYIYFLHIFLENLYGNSW